MAMFWRCPHCLSPLSAENSRAVCSNGHSFDFARQGYLNLLPANFKRSQSPGDDKAMLTARRQFLDAGYYQSLLDHLLVTQDRLVAQSNAESFTALDLGGGDGYYSARMQAQCSHSTWYLSDISKDAVKMAAARFERGRCAVASSFKLPVMDASVDWVMRNFAPADDGELKRILKPGGICLIITPGQDHLIELRRCLYDNPKAHKPGDAPTNGKLLDRQFVSETVQLSEVSHRQWLFSMTPMVWRAPQNAQQAWLNADDSTVTLSFTLSYYGFDDE